MLIGKQQVLKMIVEIGKPRKEWTSLCSSSRQAALLMR
jgi:hypothetical protein